MMSIKEIAKKETVVAEIVVGREKGETESLIKTGEVVTICDFESCLITNEQGNKEVVYAYVVEEHTDKFFFAGHVLRKIFESIIAHYDGDLSDAYQAMRTEKLKVRLGEKKTKTKNMVTTVEVVE